MAIEELKRLADSGAKSIDENAGIANDNFKELRNNIDVINLIALQSEADNNTGLLQSAIDTSSALNGFVYLRINKPGTYFIKQLKLPDNCTIEICKGVVLKRPDGYLASLFINNGALLETPGYNNNIAITGEGTIDGNLENIPSLIVATTNSIIVNSFLYGVQAEIAMIGVNNFSYTLKSIINSNGFAVQCMGNDLSFIDATCDTGRDFIHINGPSERILIENVTGFSADDFIALNAWDWRRSGPAVGDIRDVTIKNARYLGSNLAGRTGSFIKFLPGTRATGVGAGIGNIENVDVVGYTFDPTMGTVTPVSSGISFVAALDQVAGNEYSGAGKVSNVKMANGRGVQANSNSKFVSFTPHGITADGQATLSIDKVSISASVDCSVTSDPGNNAVNIVDTTNTVRIGDLSIKGVNWKPNSSVSYDQRLVQVALKYPVNNLDISDISIGANTSSLKVAAFYIASYDGIYPTTVNNLVTDGIITEQGYLHAKEWAQFGNAVITKWSGRGINIVGSGYGVDCQGIAVLDAGASVNGAIENSLFNGVKTTAYINSGSLKLSYRDTDVIGAVHPFFVDGAGAVINSTCSGGNIDTSTNLARVNAGTFSCYLSNTNMSGAGSGLITVVSSGSARVKKSDDTAISPSIVLNPHDGDTVKFSGTPAYSGVNVVSGSGAGTYIYRGTGTVGWVKLN